MSESVTLRSANGDRTITLWVLKSGVCLGAKQFHLHLFLTLILAHLCEMCQKINLSGSFEHCFVTKIKHPNYNILFLHHLISFCRCVEILCFFNGLLFFFLLIYFCFREQGTRRKPIMCFLKNRKCSQTYSSNVLIYNILSYQ